MLLTVHFRNGRGLRLAADLLLPEDHPARATVVFAPGMYSTRDSPSNRVVAERLREIGIASLLLDFTGHGESEGLMEESTVEQQVDDLGAALDFLEGQTALRQQPFGVYGSTTGGSVAVLRTSLDPRPRALVLRAPRAVGVLDAARQVRVPTLIIADGQEIVLLEESRGLYAALGGEKRLEILPGVGRRLDEPEVLEPAIELAAEWFRERLIAPPGI